MVKITKVIHFLMVSMQGYLWVKLVKWDCLPAKLINRLKMGFAGYCLPAAIVALGAPASRGESAQKNFQWKEEMVKLGLKWSVFPSTHEYSGLDWFKDLNNECYVFIYAHYSGIQVMVAQKVLFAPPPLRPQYKGWMEWWKHDLEKLGPGIFETGGEKPLDRCDCEAEGYID
jgi:hypothetical protein